MLDLQRFIRNYEQTRPPKFKRDTKLTTLSHSPLNTSAERQSADKRKSCDKVMNFYEEYVHLDASFDSRLAQAITEYDQALSNISPYIIEVNAFT